MKGLQTLPSLGSFSLLDLGKVKPLRHDSKGVTDEKDGLCHLSSACQ